ncbi:MAG: DUF4149 domain-containing protein [Campylobacteraceae bacterium]
MKKTALQKNIFAAYLLFIGILVGVELSVGALVAPVIFYPTSFLGEGVLTHFQSGILMTQIFLRFNLLLMVITLFLLSFEVYIYFSKRFDFIGAVFLFIALVGSLLFVLYFTPYIVDAQKLGAAATASEEFRNIHKASELVIKVVLFAQIALFFRRIWVEFK